MGLCDCSQLRCYIASRLTPTATKHSASKLNQAGDAASTNGKKTAAERMVAGREKGWMMIQQTAVTATPVGTLLPDTTLRKNRTTQIIPLVSEPGMFL